MAINEAIKQSNNKSDDMCPPGAAGVTFMDIWTESTRRRRGRVGRWFGKAGAYVRTMFNVNDVLIFFLSFQLAYGVCCPLKLTLIQCYNYKKIPFSFTLCICA